MEKVEAEKLSVEQDSDLWYRFAYENDQKARTELIEHNIIFAKSIAARLYMQRPSDSLEFGDYMQHALLGLIEAIDRFDPKKSNNFPAYASYRIRGSIINSLHSANEYLAQGAYRKFVRQERLQSLRSTNKTINHQDELFGEMVDVAIGLALGYMLEDSGITQEGALDEAADPYNCFEIKRLKDNLKIIVDVLPEREKAIIKQHYYDYINFDEIAELNHISKGRVSQLHKRALSLLRQAYEEMGKFDVSY